MVPSTAQVLGVFNLLVGLMLVASILFFVGGFIMYLVRLGTWPTYRDEAIDVMAWGVSILFTLIVLLAIQQFLARHIFVAVSGAALIIVLGIAYVIVRDVSTSPKPPPPRDLER